MKWFNASVLFELWLWLCTAKPDEILGSQEAPQETVNSAPRAQMSIAAAAAAAAAVISSCLQLTGAMPWTSIDAASTLWSLSLLLDTSLQQS